MEKINWKQAIEYQILEKKEKHFFYEICSNEDNIIEFQNKIDNFNNYKNSKFANELVIAGLLGAIEHNQKNFITELFSLISLETEKADIEAIFNCSCLKNNIDLIELIDNKFSIIKNVNKEVLEPMKVDDNGNILTTSDYWSKIYSLDDQRYNLKIAKYYNDILTFNVNEKNDKIINLILEKNFGHINIDIIEDLFLISCFNKESESVLYLIQNEQFRDTIKKSSSIQRFLDNKIEHLEIKKEIESAFAMIELTQELKTNLEPKKNNKPKI